MALMAKFLDTYVYLFCFSLFSIPYDKNLASFFQTPRAKCLDEQGAGRISIVTKIPFSDNELHCSNLSDQIWSMPISSDFR